MGKIEVAYLCDQKACEAGSDCSICHHTLDIRHAKNFWKMDEAKYMEMEIGMANLNYKSIKEKEDLVNHPSHYTKEILSRILRKLCGMLKKLSHFFILRKIQKMFIAA